METSSQLSTLTIDGHWTNLYMARYRKAGYANLRVLIRGEVSEGRIRKLKGANIWGHRERSETGRVSKEESKEFSIN